MEEIAENIEEIMNEGNFCELEHFFATDLQCYSEITNNKLRRKDFIDILQQLNKNSNLKVIRIVLGKQKQPKERVTFLYEVNGIQPALEYMINVYGIFIIPTLKRNCQKILITYHVKNQMIKRIRIKILQNKLSDAERLHTGLTSLHCN